MDNNAKKQLGRSVIWNTLGNLVYYASQYVLIILAQRLAGATVSGQVSVAMSIAAIALSFANYGMRSFQISDFQHKYSDAVYHKSRCLTTLAAALGCAGFAWLVSYTPQQRWVILLYTVARLSEGYIDVWHGYLQKADRMDLVGQLFGIRGLVTIAGFGLGIALTKDVVITMALLAAASWLCVLFADLPPAKQAADFAPAPSAGVWLLLWECAPLAVYSFLNSSIGSVIKLLCERIVGTEAFAYFNNVFAPVQIVQVGAMYIFAPFMMYFARCWEQKNKAGYQKGFALASAAMPVLWAAAAVAAWLLGPFCLQLLYGAEMRAYRFLLQPAVVAAVVNIYVSILCYLLSMMRAMKGLILGNLAGILAAVALSAPLVNTMGVAGAAWATVAARAVQAVCCLAVLLAGSKKHFAN